MNYSVSNQRDKAKRALGSLLVTNSQTTQMKMSQAEMEAKSQEAMSIFAQNQP